MVATTLGWFRERPLVTAIVVSIAIHASVLTLFPGLRILPIKTPSPLAVDFLPQREEAPNVQPVPPAPSEPQVKAEPTREPTHVQDRPKPRVTKPLPSVPRSREATTAAPAPQPSHELITAAPEAPSQSPQFSVPATPPIEAPPPVPVETVPDADLLAGYGQALSSAIGRHQRYPRVAQMRAWQGTTLVALNFGSGSTLVSATVEKSSGHEILDSQALEMVRDANPLPPAPASLRQRNFVVKVPIVFRLKEKE